VCPVSDAPNRDRNSDPSILLISSGTPLHGVMEDQMQHFFFNIRDDHVLVRDGEGQLLEDLDQAVALATRMAWHAGAEANSDAEIDSRRIEICDEFGRTVDAVSVRVVAREAAMS
jgi:hypothetical protein